MNMVTSKEKERKDREEKEKERKVLGLRIKEKDKVMGKDFFLTHSSVRLIPVKMIGREEQQKEPDCSSCAFLGQNVKEHLFSYGLPRHCLVYERSILQDTWATKFLF